MFHVELASWGVFLPSEVRIRGILALSRAWFYNGQKQKCKFLKKGSLPDFQIFVVIREVILQKMAPILAPVNFFSVLTLLGNCVGLLMIFNKVGTRSEKTRLNREASQGGERSHQSQSRNVYFPFFSHAKIDVKDGGVPFSWNASKVLKC